MNKWNIRSIFKDIVIALVLLFLLSNTISYIRAPELGSNQLPKLEVELLDGSQFSVKKGKPLIVHFWSTSCPACKLEAPNIENISKKYEVLTISVNAESNEKLKAYMQKNELGFKVLNDVHGRWAKQFKVEAYPTTFIYDSQGKLRFTEVGYTTTAGLLARLEWIER